MPLPSLVESYPRRSLPQLARPGLPLPSHETLASRNVVLRLDVQCCVQCQCTLSGRDCAGKSQGELDTHAASTTATSAACACATGPRARLAHSGPLFPHQLLLVPPCLVPRLRPASPQRAHSLRLVPHPSHSFAPTAPTDARPLARAFSALVPRPVASGPRSVVVDRSSAQEQEARSREQPRRPYRCVSSLPARGACPCPRTSSLLLSSRSSPPS